MHFSAQILRCCIQKAARRAAQQQLLILMLLDSLRCDDDTKGSEAAETEGEGISLKLNDMQVDVSKQIMTIAQRMCDNLMPHDLCHRRDEEEKDVHEATEGDTTATAVVVNKNRVSAKKKRNRKNKAAAKRKKKTGRMSWLNGDGVLPQIIMMALGSITTLIVCLTIIHQRVDGSSEGGSAPALPPTTSKSLLRRITQTSRNLRHHKASVVASTPSKPDAINSQPPFLFSTTSRTVPKMSPTTTLISSPTELCLDTPNWKNSWGDGCDYYEEWDIPGCPIFGVLGGDMGPATDHCCHCGGGSATLPPTSSPTITASPTLSSSPTEIPCLDTPNWKDSLGAACDYYEEWENPGCPNLGDWLAGDMGPANENCCHCGGGSATLPPTISRYPSASPTLSSSPTEPPSPCLDTPDWNDSFGEGCDYYEKYDDPGCPNWVDWYTGDMGSAHENCCHCGGGSTRTLPPTSSPSISASPTLSSNPTEPPCLDTPNWENKFGAGCDVYEEIDDPGCPNNGDLFTGDMGSASENCCHCGGGSTTLPPTSSPTITASPTLSSSPTEIACLDTPDWKDRVGRGCDWYERWYNPGCPRYGDSYTGDMGSALENCCYCGGGSTTLPPTISPYPSASPTLSSNPTEPPCLDTPEWKDREGDGCDWYEENDEQGCPLLGDLYKGDMGSASEHCCHCGGGSATLPPTSRYPSASPTLSLSPTLSSSPTETCFDTPNWKDREDDGCDWYEENDVADCPEHGDYPGARGMGSATEHCCWCGGGSVTLPPAISPYPSATPRPTDGCLDTPRWWDKFDNKCDWYEKNDDPGCPKYGNSHAGYLGSAIQRCCHCGGGDRTCEGYRSTCQNYFSVLGVKDGNLTELCKEADSCPCDGTTHDFEIITDDTWQVYTVGLYDECKCDYWLRLCEDTGEGVACDYAAEYCCGDYNQVRSSRTSFLNSPTCYCDFYNYVQNQFDHTLKAKALSENIANGMNQFSNPCDQYFRFSGDKAIAFSEITTVMLHVSTSEEAELEKISLEAIYSNTNGSNWINNSGWMNDKIPHCQWYGISCNNYRVIGLNLRDNNLQGEFPVYTYANPTYPWGDQTLESDWHHAKYGLANLFYLETLDLADNNLTGTIEHRPLYNLKSLHHFDISENQLSGGFDPLITPSIAYANFSNNLFTSMHRFQPFKVSPLQTLRSLDVSNNEIKIDATDLLQHIPQDIEQFVASSNNIHGKFLASPSLNALPKLRRFDMSFNALSGELPVFENSHFVLQDLDLSNQDQVNGFTGSIPEELWRFQSLKVLILAGNKLTGPLPPDIVNLAVLRRFDVSNNRLSGVIPPQIGQLAGTLNYLGLVNNTFSGIIPSELGDLRDASVLVRGDSFDVKAATPLSLCALVRVKYFDLADDVTSCPIERNALSNISVSAKGGEWTNDTNWNHEYTSPCDWHGVKCDENKQVTELNLSNNGLSGRLSPSIGNLTSLTKLDLSDNDIKGSIPTEIGLLTKLKYLRLSYNAFTGAAPDELADLTNLQLLQLQSNRITGMPILPKLEFDKTIFGDGKSTFVADCGVPSAFEDVLVCDNCTMCCNANEDCYPQEETLVEELGYSSFAAIILVSFTLLCCMIVFFSSRFHKQQRSALTLTIPMQEAIEQDDDYALSRIGKDSVYSYFVTDLRFGWLCAFVTLAAQAGILIFFVQASEANLQEDTTDVEFTWKCPRDTDVCSDKSDLGEVGWFFFCVLMFAFLAKDLINGFKLLYHSSKARHRFWPRIRYFIGGLSLCTITLYALYVSIVYNRAIATSNTDIILNSVVVLFIMDMDQVIFAALEAISAKWTAHVGESEDTASDAEETGGGTSTAALEEMKQKIVLQDSNIASQQEEMTRQRDEIAFLREAVQKLQDAQPTVTLIS